MPCEAFRDLLHAYIDGELDRAGARDVERHLAGCPHCVRSCEEIKALGRTLRSLLPPVMPPLGLHDGIRAALRRAEAPPVPPSLGSHRLFLALLAASVAALAGAAVGIWAIFRPAPTLPDRPTAQVTACHVQSLMGGSLVDVKDADPRVVGQWFHKRLGFVPVIPVPPPGVNFVLVGGRLDHVDQHPAAAVVYRQGVHVINLVSWPDPRGADALPPGLVFLESQGYQLAHWGRDGMIYWVITDLDAKELLAFLHHLGQATPQHCHW
jgi:anti-sigma factor RsiW